MKLKQMDLIDDRALTRSSSATQRSFCSERLLRKKIVFQKQIISKQTLCAT